MGWGRKNKFNRSKTELDGRSFASKLEASVYLKLKHMAKEEGFRIVGCQDSIYLSDARILYKPDFHCEWIESGISFWVEAKGYETPEWRLKLRLWRSYGPGDLWIFKGSYNYPKLDEIVKRSIQGYTGDV